MIRANLARRTPAAAVNTSMPKANSKKYMPDCNVVVPKKA
jgi:hypothetical protein